MPQRFFERKLQFGVTVTPHCLFDYQSNFFYVSETTPIGVLLAFLRICIEIKINLKL